LQRKHKSFNFSDVLYYQAIVFKVGAALSMLHNVWPLYIGAFKHDLQKTYNKRPIV